MINLSTPNDVLWREFNEDYDKAKYWFHKKMGDSAKIRQAMSDIGHKSYLSGQTEVSDLNEYTSKNGNHWLSCVYAINLSGRITCYEFTCLYYETIGSLGAFIPYSDDNAGYGYRMNGIVIFTSHFFLRAKSRLGFKLDSKADIVRSLLFSPKVNMHSFEDSNTGQLKMDFYLPEGVARGIIRSKDPFIVELKTCLSQQALNRKQLRETNGLRVFNEIDPSFVDPRDFQFVGNTIDEKIENARKGWIMMGGSPLTFELGILLIPPIYGFLKERYPEVVHTQKMARCFYEHYLKLVDEYSSEWNEMDEAKRDEVVCKLIAQIILKADLPKVKPSEIRNYVDSCTWEYLVDHATWNMDIV